jgi:preprotein translocase subunit SecG
MYGLLLGFHIVVCLALIGVVLLQSGKGGGLAGGAFGGTAQTVFGGRGATDFLSRATMVLGGLFFVTSLVLALMSSGTRAGRSLLQEEARRVPATAPATPGGALPPASGGQATPAAPQSAPPAGTQPATPAPASGSGGK